MVLMSLVLVASLTSLRTTIHAGRIDRDHANTFAWLQAASDAIYRAPHVSCMNGATLDPGNVQAAYHAAVNNPAAVPRPVLWEANTSATIAVTGVEFLWRTSFDQPYVWSAAGCLEADGQYTQRVTIQVTTPDGALNTLQMVKDR